MVGKKLKIYSVIITIAAAILLAAFVVLLIKQNAVKVSGSLVSESIEVTAESETETESESDPVQSSETAIIEPEETSEEETTDDRSRRHNVGNLADPDDENDAEFHVKLAWQNMLGKLDYDADIVFMGDSNIMRSDFRKYFPEYNIINLGIGGETIAGAVSWTYAPGVVDWEEVAYSPYSVKPEKLFTMLGINSLGFNELDTCVSEYEIYLDRLIEGTPNCDIYVLSVLPVSFGYQEGLDLPGEKIVSFNRSIGDLAESKGLTYIDLYDVFLKDGELDPELTMDGIHLNKAGYDLMAAEISQYVYDWD